MTLRAEAIKKGDAGAGRLLWIFAGMSLVFLGLLAIAPAKSHFSEWRAEQKRYSILAASQGKEPLAPAIHQVWNPKLEVVDRCTSCHVGMGYGEALTGDPVFGAHPAIPHDPTVFGCTPCHGGQGRATRAEAAHGNAHHWNEPLLERHNVEAGCGTCHTHLPVPSAAASERGEALFRRYDCLTCHRVAGAGRGAGPDLSFTGVRGFAADWYPRHEARAAKETTREWRTSWGAIAESDRAILDEYLRGRAGAPRLVEAKALTHELGCRGCHKVNGVGGDDGPDLSAIGRRSPADLDFRGVRGPHTLAGWLEEHFLDPERVVPGSRMPQLGVTPEQARTLTLYMLSLRARDVPEEYWPKDRIRGLRFGEREFATDGESLYGVFCAGCHGAKGEGRRFGNAGQYFPAIGNPSFLALASDDYLRATITRGRAGRRMPAWGESEGGLRPAEIDAIVAWLRSTAPGTPIVLDFQLPQGDAARGALRFERSCSGCHGARGEGREAPAIGHPAFLAAATDDYIAATILYGRSGTAMRHFGTPTAGFPTLEIPDVADVVAWLRTLAPATPARQESGS